MKAYHIVHWDSLYETANSRKVATLTYYQKPNKLVGEGIGATLMHPQNVALLGTWTLIEALASTSPRGERGWLVRNGSALTADRMAALTRVDAEHFALALAHFSKPEIGWLQFTDWTPKSGTVPGDSPTNPLLAGTVPGDSPTNIPQEERREEREEKRREERERGALTLASQSLSGPSVEEVETWATGAGVDPVFAIEKLAQAVEREDFAKPAVRKNWQSRFLRFWKADEGTWRRKCKKNAAAPGERPDGWKAGDADTWWTDTLAEVRSALHGAVSLGDKKTAARLREVLARREKGQS